MPVLMYVKIKYLENKEQKISKIDKATFWRCENCFTSKILCAYNLHCNRHALKQLFKYVNS